jgi:hypothetical protein
MTNAFRLFAMMLAAAALLAVPACSPKTTPSGGGDVVSGQLTFATPEDAVVALVDAARTGDITKVRPIFGPGISEIESDDPAKTEGDLQRFAAAYDRKHALWADGTDGVAGGGPVTLVLGEDFWEFPVPLVRMGDGSSDRWRFDTAAGVANVRAMRIETNEENAVDLLLAIIPVQEQYRQLRPLGLPAYAKRLRSSAGTRDGLWWPDELAPPMSPLGPMVEDAGLTEVMGRDLEVSRPYRGYFYRILTAAGPNAPGGATNWLDGNGNLIGGFALLAWPEQYAETGVLTFAVGMDGTVWQSDLGEATEATAMAITALDPGPGWVRQAPAQ